MITTYQHTVPDRRLSGKDAEDLINLLNILPPNAGLLISKCMEPSLSPPVFDAIHAKVILVPCGCGEANGNNIAEAVRTAWARAYMDAAKTVAPQEGK